MNTKKIQKLLCFAISILGLLSLFIFIPYVREFIIYLGEKYIGRPLTHEIWHERFINWEIRFLIADILFLCILAYFFITNNSLFYASSKGIFQINNEIKIIKNTKCLRIFILVTFAVLLGTRLFYISQKKSFMTDEGLSISICNRNEYGFWGKLYEIDREYTGKELKDISLWDNSSIKDSFIDIFHMHKSNRDTPHTNFYYSLFRLWFTGVKTSNLKYIFWRGCLLNVLFFTISFIFMTLLIRRFTDNPLIQHLSLLIAFINPASLSLTIFLRPYELQQTFVIILTYYVTCILQAEAKNLVIETKKNFILGVAVLSFTMLSAYFNMLLIGLYGFFIIVLCIFEKKWSLLRFFIIMFIASLLVSKFLYFDFCNMGYRGREAASNLNGYNNIKANIIAVKNGIMKIISKNSFFEVFCILVLVSTVFTFSKGIKNKNIAISVIVLANLIYFFLIMYFVPIDMKTLRYVAPTFPIFALSFINFNYRKNMHLITSGFIVLILSLSLIPNKGKSSIEHLDDIVIKRYKEIQETNLPIFVRGESTWRYSTLIPYLNDDCSVIFISDFSKLQELYSDKIPCIFINQDDESDAYNFNSENLLIKTLTSLSYHDVYLIEN